MANEKPGKSIVMPDIPDQAPLVEDFVAALFQSAGYYVEQNVVEAEKDDAGTRQFLEMDVVATRYRGDERDVVVGEAKSGDAHVKEIFKLLGWLTYLQDGSRGAFFSLKPFKDHTEEALNRRFNPHNIHCIHAGDYLTARTKFEAAGFGQVGPAYVFEQWRWVYIAFRKLVGQVGLSIKQGSAPEGSRAAIDYHKLINNGVFFEPSIVARAAALYGAFQSHPKLCLSVANELATGVYAEGEAGRGRFRQAMFYGNDPLLQACMFFEHRARLAILEAVTDFAWAGDNPHDDPEWLGNAAIVPNSFWNAAEAFKTHEYRHLYPVFWQVLLWGFGGFYLRDRKDKEFGLLSELTGIPVAAIPKALTALDVLFPMAGGWWYSNDASAATVIKVFPPAVRGLGVNFRKAVHGIKQIGDLGYQDRTAENLSIWFRCSFDLLSSETAPKLKIEDMAAPESQAKK